MSKVAFNIILPQHKDEYQNSTISSEIFSEHGFKLAGEMDDLFIMHNNIQPLILNAINRKMEHVFIYFYGPCVGQSLSLLNNQPNLDVQFFEQLFTQFPKVKFTILLDTHEGSKDILDYFKQNSSQIASPFVFMGNREHVKRPGFIGEFAREMNKLKTGHEKRKEAFDIFKKVVKHGEVVSNHDGKFLQ